MQIEPLGNRVLVKRSKVDDTTPGGIVIPPCAHDPSMEATVVSVGDGDKASRLAVGDVIIFANHTGHKVKANKEELLLIDYDNILAKVIP